MKSERAGSAKGRAELAARDIALGKEETVVSPRALHLGSMGARRVKPREIGSKGNSSQGEKRGEKKKRDG
jgi:hypothetical protein